MTMSDEEIRLRYSIAARLFGSRSRPPMQSSATLPDTFSDNFAAGLNSRWEFTNSAWAAAAGSAVGTPTLGAELFANTGFTTDTSWSKGTGWTIAAGVGSHAAGTAASVITQAVGTTGSIYKLVMTFDYTSGSGMSPYHGASTQIGVSRTVDGTYTCVNKAAGTALGARANGSTTLGTVDNASAKLVTLSDTMASISGLKNEANISVNPTIAEDNIGGLVGWQDSYTNPQNYLHCYVSRQSAAQLKLDKIVAGVTTNLITATITYSAGATLTLKGHRSGASLLLDAFYNGAQIGTQQTVSDAAIVDTTRHGLFSPSELNSLDNFDCSAYA